MVNKTFRTSLNITPPPFRLNLNSKTLLLGSCFSENIGLKLENIKLDTLTNPYGTLFHPTAILNALEYTLNTKKYNKSLTTLKQDVWFHYQFHSSVRGLTETSLLNLIDSKINEAQTFYKKCDTIVLTFGTAFYYNLISSDTAVSNCHKTPQKNFSKHLISVTDIVSHFSSIYDSTNLKNKNIVLTVSPVRHIKDTLELNSVSKSILRIACHELASKYGNVIYFPSFEIINDDLRDYRFYKEDLIHPNDQAINYIWEIFKNNYFLSEDIKDINEIEKINTSLEHKPFNPESGTHQDFLKSLLKKMIQLNNKIDFTKEIEILKKQIT